MDGRSTKLLFDLVSSCWSIVERSEGRTCEDQLADRFLRRGVEREFEIIAEALNRLSQSYPETASRMRDLPRIVSFRNRIPPQYDRE